MLGAWARAFLEKRFESFGVQGLMAGKAAVCSSKIRKDAFEVLLEQNSSMRAHAFEGAEGERSLGEGDNAVLGSLQECFQALQAPLSLPTFKIF